jgi:hypothetical protein
LQSVDLEGGSRSSEFRESGGVIYPWSQGGISLNVQNTPGIVAAVRHIQDVVAQRRAERQQMAEMVVAFTNAIARLGAVRSMAPSWVAPARPSGGTPPARVDDTVPVYRVEFVDPNKPASNSRRFVGNRIEGLGKAKKAHGDLYLNFGDEARALEYWAQKDAQGLATDIKVFSVPRTFLESLRRTSVPQNLGKSYPLRPVRVDETKAADQFGLRAPQIRELERILNSVKRR